MSQQEMPFEYHNNILGVKIIYLIQDRHYHKNSLRLISYNALNKRIRSKTSCEKELRRASLGCDALIEFYSLKQEWRDLLVFSFGEPKKQVVKSFFAHHYVSDRSAFDVFAAYRYGDDNARKLEPEVIELYTYNASMINTVIQVKTNRKAYLKALGVVGTVDIWESLSRDVNSFTEVRHDLPTTKDSLRHKVNRYIKEGPTSIISRKYGTKNAAKLKEKSQIALIEELLSKHQNLNNEQVTDLYNITSKLQGWEEISSGVVANKRKELNLFTFAGQRGSTELMHKVHMQNKRSRPTIPMIYWTMDGWDSELLYQKTTINDKGNSVTTYHNRHNVVIVLDPFKDYIIGYAIGTNETPELIRKALKNAINHTTELFGKRHKPWQLQTDNYQIKNLRPTYEAVCKHFTPAKVKNSKSKIIEQWFDKFNERSFQANLTENWSGHNITARKENQVNADYLSKVSRNFPDEMTCRNQLIAAIENDRAKNIQSYLDGFKEVPEVDKLEMNFSSYMKAFGLTTGYTNRFRGEGLTPTINGVEMTFDTFNSDFRRYMYVDWMVRYDPDDFTKILVTDAESINGKLKKEIGKLEFELDQKYIQPMAIYDQNKGDNAKRQLVTNFNKDLNNSIINRNIERKEILQDLFTSNPELEMLQKLVLPNSQGQHKDQKSVEHIRNAQKVLNKQLKQDQKQEQSNWSKQQEEYLKGKIDISKYMNS